MSTEESKNVVLRFIEAARAEKLASVDTMGEFLARDSVHHFGTGQQFSREEYTNMFARYYEAFSDLEYVPQEVIAEGDTVAVRFLARGTHLHPIFGCGPTGKVITYTSTYFYRVANGRIQEDWENMDVMGFQAQLDQAAHAKD